jgi:hypothetical protein
MFEEGSFVSRMDCGYELVSCSVVVVCHLLACLLPFLWQIGIPSITRHATLSVATDDFQTRSTKMDLIDGECILGTSRRDQHRELVYIESPLSLFSPFASG